jgi:hypothetical protein
VILDGIDREADDLGSALGELAFETGHGAELGGADGSEVLGVREEDGPVVADPLVELYRAMGAIGRKVGGFVVDP